VFAPCPFIFHPHLHTPCLHTCTDSTEVPCTFHVSIFSPSIHSFIAFEFILWPSMVVLPLIVFSTVTFNLHRFASFTFSPCRPSDSGTSFLGDGRVLLLLSYLSYLFPATYHIILFSFPIIPIIRFCLLPSLPSYIVIPLDSEPTLTC
jgi:hypothetical protein